MIYLSMNRINKSKARRWAKGIIPVCLFAFLPFHKATAQAVKTITVSQQASYTDHVSLKSDAKDMDLMVKFIFNETDNTLSVSLVSYRGLFVFWDNTRYQGAIKRRWIRPEKLSYVVSSNPDDHFRLTKAFRNSLPAPYRKHIFKKWIEYEGVQPTDTALQMVNDYISQTFNIQGKRSAVTIRLRDLMLMDEVRQNGTSSYYEISYGKDLNTEYQIAIQRNPCFGLDEEVGAARNALAAITKSFASFKKRYGKGKVANNEALKSFRDLQETLTVQFPHNNDSSLCPDIQQARDQYNLIADSIAKIKVTVDANPAEALAAIGGAEGRAINAKSILSNARLLDSMVSRWLVSSDDIERSDLITQCNNLVKETTIMIGNSNGQTPEERHAVNLFRQAEQYFKRTCK